MGMIRGAKKWEICEKRGKYARNQKKLKIFQKYSFKCLTGACKFDIIGRLCKYALYGLMREVTENPRQKAALADNFR